MENTNDYRYHFVAPFCLFNFDIRVKALEKRKVVATGESGAKRINDALKTKLMGELKFINACF